MQSREQHQLIAHTALILVVLVAIFVPANLKSQKSSLSVRPTDPGQAQEVSFSRDIRPVLLNHCAGCHAGETATSGFRVTSVPELLAGGTKAGPAVISGKPEESPLVQYIRGVRQPRMPKGAAPLTDEQLHLIRLWIQAGGLEDTAVVASDTKKKKPAQKTVPQADYEQLANALLFATDNEELLKLRRNWRLKLVSPPPEPPEVKGPTHNAIDRFIVTKWEGAGLEAAIRPPDVCDDLTFLRRVYLDVVGVIPTIAEAKRFLFDPSPHKRTNLVDELLSRDKDYAAHWVPFWEDALASANVPFQAGVPTHGNYREWIYQNFLENEPYDVMVAELIDPTMAGHKPSITRDINGLLLTSGFIRNNSHQDTLQSAADIGQVFLGTSMKCASCHDHLKNPEWPQTRFLAFAGMLAPDDLELIRCEKQTGLMVPARFPFELPGAPSEVPKTLKAGLRRFAQLLTDPTNSRFVKTIVNRLWKRYLGYGLYEPADDYRLDRPPTHPELLDWLAYDFVSRGYDLKHTIRLILNSRTYQLRYDPDLEDHFDRAKPRTPRYFRSPALRRLTAEQLIDTIRLAANQELPLDQRLYLYRTSSALTRALGLPASRNQVSTSRPDDVGVLQALELMNGEEFDGLVYSSPILSPLASREELDEIIETLYWAALSRPPSAAERNLGVSYLKESNVRKGGGKEPLEFEVWIDDSLPEGADDGGEGDDTPWRWVTAPKHPVFSGKRSHTQNIPPLRSMKLEQRAHHAVEEAQTPLLIGPRDILFGYTYLDPVDPPREIMLQWNRGDGWDHRAYWGEDLIELGEPHSPSRQFRGPLPEPGEWVKLEVPVAAVGLDIGRKEITGWSFDHVGGVVYWDKAGVLRMPRPASVEPLGDILWALFTSPAFQYIH